MLAGIMTSVICLGDPWPTDLTPREARPRLYPTRSFRLSRGRRRLFPGEARLDRPAAGRARHRAVARWPPARLLAIQRGQALADDPRRGGAQGGPHPPDGRFARTGPAVVVRTRSP